MNTTVVLLGDGRDIERQAAFYLGPVRDSLTTVVPMTILYVVILFTGTIGNICTCIVIAQNKYMHTATNLYLANLAISDLLLLLLGLPQELFMLWQKYPYVFGEFFCFVRGLSSETSTNASILTIQAFTIERYLAICHPLKSHTISPLPRAIKSILIIWAASAICALPVAWQFGIVSVVNTARLHSISRQCSIKTPIFEYCFETSAIVFFLVPITLIIILYVLIGLKLRKSSSTNKINNLDPSSLTQQPKEMLAHYSETRAHLPMCAGLDGSTTPEIHVSLHNNHRHNSVASSQQKQIASRRSVIRMLVAVVIGFLCSYSLFHAQRVLASLVARRGPSEPPSPTLVFMFTLFTHISGVTYYLSATINPILYQLLSQKFRLAFKDTFGRCLPCVRVLGVPEITYSNIAGGGGASSCYKLSRTGSVYSNGSFRRTSINFDIPGTPGAMRKTNSVGHFSFDASDHCSTVGERVPVQQNEANDEKQQSKIASGSLTVPNISQSSLDLPHCCSSTSLPANQSVDGPAEPANQFLLVPSFKF